MAATLFVSDLHLPDGPSPLREGFLALLQGPARKARALYLLGDVFEYWIGDDDGLRRYATEIAALQALSGAGVALAFMPGNRDFLVGRGFARATGARLLPDPSIVEADGRRLLVSHGDLWCSDDRAYQRWRRFSRNRIAQWLFLRLPRARREAIAGGLRGQSDQAKRNKAESIMDVHPDAVARAFDAHGVDCIVHGHTHRPADHALTLAGDRPATRIVLADWQPQRMEYLVAEGGRLRRESIAPLPRA